MVKWAQMTREKRAYEKSEQARPAGWDGYSNLPGHMRRGSRSVDLQRVFNQYNQLSHHWIKLYRDRKQNEADKKDS